MALGSFAAMVRLVCRMRGEQYEKGREALDRVGLGRMMQRSIRELSMGQRRRAVLAAAWIGWPRIILLDEPLESMDRAMREETLAWIDRSLASGASVVVATHEIEPFLLRAVRAVTISDGLCRLHDPLPAAGIERAALLELLSRGKA